MTDTLDEARQALRTFAVGAVALVVASTVLFSLVDAVADDTDDGVTITSPTEEPSDVVTDAPTASEEATEVTSSEPTEATSEAASEQPTTATSEPAAPPASLDAATGLTVQVLDAVLDDGRALHAGVVACMREAGFTSLIVQNSASRVYDVTTVFYIASDGTNQAAAQAIADAFGFAAVEVAPDNLNADVPLHVIVGRDATDPC